METKLDTKYCYGACCTWHGPIQNAIDSGGIPGCPYCGGPLYQMDNKDIMDERVAEFQETRNLPFYAEWYANLNNYGCIPLQNWRWDKSYDSFVENIKGM